jgi:hypothetical protein
MGPCSDCRGTGKASATLHPLDETELALKAAARAWQHESDNRTVAHGSGVRPTDPDAAFQALKDAARAYGEAWRRHVTPAGSST